VALVDEHRHAAARIHAQEGRADVRVGARLDQLDRMAPMGDAELGQADPRLHRAERERVVVELEGLRVRQVEVPLESRRHRAPDAAAPLDGPGRDADENEQAQPGDHRGSRTKGLIIRSDKIIVQLTDREEERRAMARAAAAAQTTAGSREMILGAALRAFAAQGFDGSSTREIAARAGVNHGLISYYFGTKLKLWQAAVDLAFEELGEGVAAILADPSFADDRARIARLIRAYVRFVAQHPEFVRLMHEEGKRSGPRMRWISDRHVKPLYQAVEALLERGRARGTLRIDASPLHFFYVLAGAAGVIFHQSEECKRLSGIDPFDAAVVEEHARVVERLLLGALAPESR
jgi:AcrR family transcriptional regulator